MGFRLESMKTSKKGVSIKRRTAPRSAGGKGRGLWGCGQHSSSGPGWRLKGCLGHTVATILCQAVCSLVEHLLCHRISQGQRLTMCSKGRFVTVSMSRWRAGRAPCAHSREDRETLGPWNGTLSGADGQSRCSRECNDGGNFD